jgi:hypothetical protein
MGVPYACHTQEYSAVSRGCSRALAAPDHERRMCTSGRDHGDRTSKLGLRTTCASTATGSPTSRPT